MHQNILELYSKAQAETLAAQDVAWLESQTRDNPYFGMAYMVLARHHLANKSTIKDRALVKGAAYAHDRMLLRSYLESALPRPRPEAPISLEKAATVPETAEETPAAEVQAEPADTAQPLAEVPATEAQTEVKESVSEGAPPDLPEAELAEAETEPASEVEAEAPVAEATASEKQAGESTEAEVAETPPQPLAHAEFTPEEIPINWFLNMRIKLRTDKYNGRLEKLRAEVGEFAPALAAASPSATSPSPATPPAETADTKPPVAQTSTPETPQAETLPPDTKPAAKKTPATASPLPKEKVARPVTQPAAEAPVTEKPEYEIGAFSSFTFLEDRESADPDESEIDTMMTLSESVEIETDSAGNGPGQITFEEKDRIVEVTVSPEELAKYFKGRLPVELNFSHQEELPTEATAQQDEHQTPEFSGPLTDDPPPAVQQRIRTSEIIERFIEEEPTISRIGSVEVPQGDLSRKDEAPEQEWVTETLARIYAGQGNKARARRIYETLALRFPEKSDYFADLIHKL